MTHGSECERIVAGLEGDELLLYVSRGGKILNRTMQLRYAAALGDLGLTAIPSPADLTKLIVQRMLSRRRYASGDVLARKKSYCRRKGRRPRRVQKQAARAA